MDQPTPTQAPARPGLLGILYNVVRGALIAVAELIPGVSGGTIALIVGVYERVLDSANHVIGGIRTLVTGPDRWAGFKERLGKADWWLLVPLLVGMGAAVLSLAGIMEHFVTQYPLHSRGLFFGMVAASIVVPLGLVAREVYRDGRWLRYLPFALVAAGLAYFLTSSGSGTEIKNPSMLLVFVAASVAICALALPGVSGSFFLLVIGLYAPTLRAVSERDLGYIAVFGLGAIVGLSLFVKGLHWLLHRYHAATMFTMAGLLLGSLRALWPWQGEGGSLQGPGEHVVAVAGLAILGVVVVQLLLLADRALGGREESDGTEEGAHGSQVVEH